MRQKRQTIPAVSYASFASSACFASPTDPRSDSDIY